MNSPRASCSSLACRVRVASPGFIVVINNYMMPIAVLSIPPPTPSLHALRRPFLVNDDIRVDGIFGPTQMRIPGLVIEPAVVGVPIEVGPGAGRVDVAPARGTAGRQAEHGESEKKPGHRVQS